MKGSNFEIIEDQLLIKGHCRTFQLCRGRRGRRGRRRDEKVGPIPSFFLMSCFPPSLWFHFYPLWPLTSLESQQSVPKFVVPELSTASNEVRRPNINWIASQFAFYLLKMAFGGGGRLRVWRMAGVGGVGAHHQSASSSENSSTLCHRHRPFQFILLFFFFLFLFYYFFFFWLLFRSSLKRRHFSPFQLNCYELFINWIV